MVAGVWAVLAPQGWFDNFPGWSPRLVAALPPFNEHLATDAGAGLLAAGLVVWLAAWLMRRDVILTAMVAYLAFSVPHALYHMVNPADALSTAEDAVNVISLWVGVALAAVLLWGALRDGDRTAGG